VREEALEQAVLDVLGMDVLTEAQIARALQAVEAWQYNGEEEALERATELQISQIDDRLDALTDALLERLIDKESCLRRRERLLIERAAREEQLRLLREQFSYVRMIGPFLERLKSLAVSYRFSAPTQKREIVEIALSNRQVIGKKPSATASNWLEGTADALSAYRGAPDRSKNRRLRKMDTVHIEKLIALAQSEEARRLFGKKDDEGEPDLPLAA
jgi:hypothetical protein